MTRGLHEAATLGRVLGAEESTIFGLAGMGDLVSCATLPSHKGYAAGRAVCMGGNIPLEFLYEIQAILGIAGKHQIELPITQAILAIVQGKIQPLPAINMLMRRTATQE